MLIPMPHADALDWLLRHRTPEEAWAYRVGGPAQAEPTLLAVAAGAPEPRAWLDSADLGWAELLLPAAVVRAAVVPAAELGKGAHTELREVDDDELASLDRRERALETILERKGDPSPVPGDFNGQLVGWNWVDGTFSWVQPTCWAMLSLKSAALTEHPRFVEGLELLTDRQGADGGWNYGNPDALGQQLGSYLYLTGWVLLVLDVDHPGADAAFAFLEGVRERPSTTNLATAVLARLAHGRDASVEAELLRARQLEDGSFGEAIERTAIAACALRALELGDCPFAPSAGPIEAPPTAEVPHG